MGDNWLIGPANHKIIRKAAPANLKSISLFKVGRWLTLSQRVFMNAAEPDYNWKYLPGRRAPAIRATALEDFRSLLISLTRRLVATSLSMAESRARSKGVYYTTRRRVRRRDVEAATASLGLKTNSKDFWAKCARRLGIHVHDESNDAEEAMPYHDVEAALVSDCETEDTRDDLSPEELSATNQDLSEDNLSSGNAESVFTVHSDTGRSSSEESLTGAADSVEFGSSNERVPRDDDVQSEMKELFRHSIPDFLPVRKPKRAIRDQITRGLAQQAYAEKLDAHFSMRRRRRCGQSWIDNRPNRQL